MPTTLFRLSENWKITHYSDKEFLSVTGPNTCMLMDQQGPRGNITRKDLSRLAAWPALRGASRRGLAILAGLPKKQYRARIYATHMGRFVFSSYDFGIATPTKLAVSIAYNHERDTLSCAVRTKNSVKKVQTRQASDLKEALALQASLLRMMEKSS